MKRIITYPWRHRIQILKFLAVGGSSFVIDFCILYSLTEFAHWHYLLSATLAFLVAAMYNYTLNRNWTFKTNGSQKKQLPAFLLTGGTALLLNNLILFVSVDTFGLWYIYGKIIATAVVTFWNFFINKYFTFRLK
jgi:putative flippase GtrA